MRTCTIISEEKARYAACLKGRNLFFAIIKIELLPTSAGIRILQIAGMQSFQHALITLALGLQRQVT